MFSSVSSWKNEPTVFIHATGGHGSKQHINLMEITDLIIFKNTCALIMGQWYYKPINLCSLSSLHSAAAALLFLAWSVYLFSFFFFLSLNSFWAFYIFTTLLPVSLSIFAMSYPANTVFVKTLGKTWFDLSRWWPPLSDSSVWLQFLCLMKTDNEKIFRVYWACLVS